MHRHILVVDDEPDIRRLIAELLTATGYRVQTAADGQAALDQIAQDPPDLIITDLMMPRCDGLSVLQAGQRASVTIPVLLMSAAPLWPGNVDAPFVTKPFDADVLLEHVERLLATSRR